MLNTKSIQAVDQASFSSAFVKPLYDSYCFSNIPPTITNVLLGENKRALPDDVLAGLPRHIDKLVLLLVDGFGWQFVKRFTPRYPFLQKLQDKGVISKLTTQFPSTTSAALTTLYTGKPVGEHGVYEWVYYEPKVDALISPLLFSFAGKLSGEKVSNTLTPTGVNPKELFPTATLTTHLSDRGVPSYAFRNQDYLDSPYYSVMFQDATNIGFSSLEEGCLKLRERLLKDKGKGYYHFYYEKIDQVCHKFGPDSAELETAVDEFCNILETTFMQPLEGKLDRTLFMMTADHGQVAIKPNQTLYLNKQFPNVIPWFKTNNNGELLVPAGGCRDMFLHIKDEYLDEAELFFKSNLEGLCEVYRTEDLIVRGLFGPSVSDTFRARVGNLILLPTTSTPIWWYEKDRFEVSQKGHHGGLSRAEAETFLTCFSFTRGGGGAKSNPVLSV